MNKLAKYEKVIKELFLYGMIGGTSALIDSIFYYVLTRNLMLNEFSSNFISVNIGITISFILNTFINFKKSDKLVKRGISFYTVGYIGLCLSMLILYVGVNIFHLHDMFVKLMSIFIVALFQFILNKLITYGRI